jgi:hypothetical protein
MAFLGLRRAASREGADAAAAQQNWVGALGRRPPVNFGGGANLGAASTSRFFSGADAHPAAPPATAAVESVAVGAVAVGVWAIPVGIVAAVRPTTAIRSPMEANAAAACCERDDGWDIRERSDGHRGTHLKRRAIPALSPKRKQHVYAIRHGGEMKWTPFLGPEVKLENGRSV